MKHCIEVLESRIAPAAFYVSGTDLTIHNGTAEATYDTAAQTATGATKVVLLHKGDTLVYDLNNNHKTDRATDTTLLTVTAGQAEVFFTDVNNDGKFETFEFTGLAVGQGFKGTLTGDLQGDVATLLDAAGTFSATLQVASISGLTVTGHIMGGIVAGQDISGITVKLPKGADPTQLSVGGGLHTGTAQPGAVELGPTQLTTTFTPTTGSSGGNISNINLVGGTTFIAAGDAGAGNGTGGSITGITLGGFTGVDLEAGDGGHAATGVGGAGGSITGVKIVTHTSSAIKIIGGLGGQSDSGAGGKGGTLSAITLSALTDLGSDTVQVLGGDGGAGGGTGNGGAAGAVLNSTFIIPRVGNAADFQGGFGGAAGSGVAVGGKGGDLTNLKITAAGSTVTNNGLSNSGLFVAGGEGGTAGGGAGGSVGGAGGTISGLTLLTTGTFRSSILTQGGQGGAGGNGTGDGGKGGDILKATATFAETLGQEQFRAGGGGSGGASGGSGGGGGKVDTLTAKSFGYSGGLYAYAGYGGSAAGNATPGNGGKGGDTNKVTFTNIGGAKGIGIYTANGGVSYATIGNGGDAGNLTNATINNLGAVGSDDIYMAGYYGGGAYGTSGNGGKGGSVGNVRLDDKFGTKGMVFIYAGSGGSGAGPGGKGGDAGTLSGAVVNAPFSTTQIGSSDPEVGDGGDGLGATGGDGGLITKISGTVGILDVLAYPGGAIHDLGGTAGNGGNVDGVKFTVTKCANIIRAGNGGDSSLSDDAGRGGSIKNVSIVGDIGDFTQEFNADVDYQQSGMGGLVVGKSGAKGGTFEIERNGVIDHVTATRIAAIVAGPVGPTVVTRDNAVLSITNLKASVIGADVNRNGLFDYEENTGNNTFDFYVRGQLSSDLLIDGIVLVKTGNFIKPPVPPLKLIEV